MELLNLLAVLGTVVGSVGWIVALFRYSSENKKDQAAATLSLQEANTLLLEQYQALLARKDAEIAQLTDELKRCQHQQKRDSLWDLDDG